MSAARSEVIIVGGGVIGASIAYSLAKRGQSVTLLERGPLGQEASAAAEQMSASSEEITASLQELDRIAGQSAKSSETITAATEEQIATIDEIAQSSSSLNHMATALKEMAHQFQIKE